MMYKEKSTSYLISSAARGINIYEFML
jgi:hypothetical protein